MTLSYFEHCIHGVDEIWSFSFQCYLGIVCLSLASDLDMQVLSLLDFHLHCKGFSVPTKLVGTRI